MIFKNEHSSSKNLQMDALMETKKQMVLKKYEIHYRDTSGLRAVSGISGLLGRQGTKSVIFEQRGPARQ